MSKSYRTIPDNAAKRWASLNNEVVNCRACPRLVEWREKIAQEKRRAFRDWDYWGKPVPGFGDRAVSGIRYRVYFRAGSIHNRVKF